MNLIEMKDNKNVKLKLAEQDRYVPDDFYSTTNHQTFVYLDNKWQEVEKQRMDTLIVIEDGRAFCKKLRDIKKGDLVVCGERGVKIVNRDETKEDGSSFSFMSNQVSSERRNDMLIKNLAYELVNNNKKLTLVAGPVIVHTGGDAYLSQLIEKNYVSSMLAGNAIAVHDIEKDLYGTSLGVSSKTGLLENKGYRNHIRAINKVNKYGSIENAVKEGALKSGIMYQCVKNEIPFVLAGSLRDDGPLPDTITDMIDAQEAYSEQIEDAEIVLVLGTMLHGIATGNMLSTKAKMICVDINPSVVTKLSDRGSSQAIGIVTDVGLFLNLLLNEVKACENTKGMDKITMENI